MDTQKRKAMCMHSNCYHPARRIISHESPNHKQFLGQTHDCCGRHGK